MSNTTDTTGTTSVADLSEAVVDTTYDVLADPVRRAVVAAVVEDGRTTVEALAERLADDDERLAEIRLIHCHLPKLAESGAVDYDHEAGVVEPGADAPAHAAALALDTTK